MPDTNRRSKKIKQTQDEIVRLGERVSAPPPQSERSKAARARNQAMMNRVGSEHITPVGGNVFLDLGFSPDVADEFKAESDAIIRNKGFE